MYVCQYLVYAQIIKFISLMNRYLLSTYYVLSAIQKTESKLDVEYTFLTTILQHLACMLHFVSTQ